MYNCNKCNKNFTKRGLEQHKTKIPNCIYKCTICLKIYASQQSLKKHSYIICKQRYECEKCNKIFKLKYDKNFHKCFVNEDITKNVSEDNTKTKDISESKEILDLIKDIPISDNKHIVIIHNNNNNIYNNIYNKEINSNNNNKINNNNNKINFLETNPKWLNYGFDDNKYKNYSKYNEDFNEEMADMYLYEEESFKKKYKEEIVLFEKKTLELEGFKILHTELQKDPKYQNVRIKKSKSGKCYIYNGKWEEIPLHKAITKICSKLCNSLYDKETSVNQFLNLVIGSQPRRMTALRKHIEENIIKINNITLIEEKQIEE